MEYGRLIRDAWQMTWRHPFLWLLGLFAGGTAGASFNGGGRGGGGAPPGADGRMMPEMPFPGMHVGPESIGLWASEHLWLILGVVALLVVVGLALLVLSLIAQGGLTGATVDFASGRSSSLGRAWRTGLHLFWRYAGLWLLLVATVALIAALVAAFVATIIWLTTVVQQTAWVIAPAVLVGLLLVMAGIVAGVVASIVVPFAQRAIAAQNLGPLAALRDGWTVFRGRPGASLLIWLINLALNVGAGLAVTVVMLVTLLALGVPAAALWSLFQFSTPTVTYLVVAGIVALGALLTLVSITNTFFWSYWTLAYLRLRPGPPTNTPTETPA
ncbi:MAG: hypothetical protein AB7P40_28455 [Chloroflexota bacterium]